MLEQLMQEIHAGSTIETRTLAARLGTSPQLIEAMLEHLQRSGLIQPYENCSDGCQGCNVCDACNKVVRDDVRLWQSKSTS